MCPVAVVVMQDAWCRFDILVVAVSIVGVVLDLGTPADLQFLPLLRVLRVVRIFRLVPKAEGLRVLLRTLFMSLPGKPMHDRHVVSWRRCGRMNALCSTADTP